MKNALLRSILQIKKLTAETLELRSSLESTLLLFIAIHDEGVRIVDVLKYADVTPLAARQHVQRLIDLGYIQMTGDPSDQRAKRVRLTVIGRGKIAHLEQSVAHLFSNLDASLAETERGSSTSKVY